MKKKIYAFILMAVITAASAFSPITASADSAEITGFSISGGYSTLTDGNISTYSAVQNITISNAAGASSVYIIFWNCPREVTVRSGDICVVSDNDFLHQFIDFGESTDSDIQITLSNTANISEIRVFADGNIPQDVQMWKNPLEKADLLLISTHADDEQLFFAGILPYFAGEKGLGVQVAYFTDHNTTPARRHELLSGLWTVGVTAYPVISAFPDEYSESYSAALKNFEKHGFCEDDVYAFQVELLRRFRPLVVVGHDLDGEYGHGQHILNSTTLTKAVTMAEDESLYTESAQKYGTWATPKLYLHLYSENQITLDWDIPLEKFGGATAFEITQKGFSCHKSQYWTWFKNWIFGKNNEITKASEIQTYSPCKFGLYRSTVGADTGINDMFENITTYAEQDRIMLSQQEDTKVPDSAQSSDAHATETAGISPIIATLSVLITLAAVIAIILIRKK